MNESSDDILASANASLDRQRGREPVIRMNRPRGRRRGDTVRNRLIAIGVVNAILLIVASVVGFVVPIGLFGALAVLLLMVAATLAIAFAPTGAPPTFEKLREAPVAALPAQTGAWLDAQRPALPAPAIGLVDQIGVRLDTLGPQLATLDPETPAAAEVRKLVGERLPDFVRDYQRVPPPLRTIPRNGKTPDAQLVDGLKLIEHEIGEMSNQLAQGDLDALATRGRFLEIKYRGDEAGG